MKKVLFGLFALSTVAMAAETNLYLRTGADLYGKYDVISVEGYDVSDEDLDEFSYEFAIEATREIYPDLEVGVGLAYQKHGDPETYSTSESEYGMSFYDKYEIPGYTSIPLYLTAKYKFNAVNNFVPYIKANLGYSFNDKDGSFGYSGTAYDSANDELYSLEFDGKVDVKVEDGLYYGIGAGFEYNNFTMDLMYQVNKADAKIALHVDEETYKFKKDYDYSRITLGFGYKFNLDI